MIFFYSTPFPGEGCHKTTAKKKKNFYILFTSSAGTKRGVSCNMNNQNHHITIIRQKNVRKSSFLFSIDWFLFFLFLIFFYPFSRLSLFAFRRSCAIIVSHQSARLVAALNICPLNVPWCAVAIFDSIRTIINFH